MTIYTTLPPVKTIARKLAKVKHMSKITGEMDKYRKFIITGLFVSTVRKHKSYIKFLYREALKEFGTQERVQEAMTAFIAANTQEHVETVPTDLEVDV